jgi:hypothetical protein
MIALETKHALCGRMSDNRVASYLHLHARRDGLTSPGEVAAISPAVIHHSGDLTKDFPLENTTMRT